MDSMEAKVPQVLLAWSREAEECRDYISALEAIC